MSSSPCSLAEEDLGCDLVSQIESANFNSLNARDQIKEERTKDLVLIINSQLSTSVCVNMHCMCTCVPSAYLEVSTQSSVELVLFLLGFWGWSQSCQDSTTNHLSLWAILTAKGLQE